MTEIRVEIAMVSAKPPRRALADVTMPESKKRLSMAGHLWVQKGLPGEKHG